MPEPVTSTIATYFSVPKILSIISGVCGSMIPILALADRTKITFVKGCFMAVTGASFAIFVGPLLCEKFGVLSTESTSAVSWVMGVTGVYLIRAVLGWMDKRGEDAIDKLVNRAIGEVKPDKEEDYDMRGGRKLPPRRDDDFPYYSSKRPKNPYLDDSER